MFVLIHGTFSHGIKVYGPFETEKIAAGFANEKGFGQFLQILNLEKTDVTKESNLDDWKET